MVNINSIGISIIICSFKFKTSDNYQENPKPQMLVHFIISAIMNKDKNFSTGIMTKVSQLTDTTACRRLQTNGEVKTLLPITHSKLLNLTHPGTAKWFNILRSIDPESIWPFLKFNSISTHTSNIAYLVEIRVCWFQLLQRKEINHTPYPILKKQK